MTVKELSQLYWLKREVELNRRQLADLEAQINADQAELSRLRCSVDGLASPSLSGMPHGTGVRSPVESMVEHIMALEDALAQKRVALVNLTARISARQTLIILERDRLEQYIGTIEDSNLRQMFTLRYADGLTWERVAAGMGAGYLPDTVRKACYRYIRQH